MSRDAALASEPEQTGGERAISEQIEDARLRAVFSYWQDKAGGRPMPARTDIDPAELKPYLPNLALIDVEGDPPRYRYRLVGTELTSILGRELRGRHVDEMPLLHRRFALAAYDKLLHERMPTYARIDTFIPFLFSVRYERLLLPLAPDGERVNMVLAAFYRF